MNVQDQDLGKSPRERPLEPEEVLRVYRQRAPGYDLSSHLYWLVGYRLDGYRREGVEALRLARGDTVVEIGCGTGHNFPLLVDAVGAEGRVVGVDLTAAMLVQAQRRVERAGWRNVELVCSDAVELPYPPRIDAVLSTYALTLVPGFDEVIRRTAAALGNGKRMVVVDFKAPERWPQWLLEAIVPVLRPFGVTLGLQDRHPWESMRRHFGTLEMRERYLGTTYIAIGERSRASSSAA